jgi:VIT1/CCC1 family predicted Fe2+/Mn2+ transporter
MRIRVQTSMGRAGVRVYIAAIGTTSRTTEEQLKNNRIPDPSSVAGRRTPTASGHFLCLPDRYSSKELASMSATTPSATDVVPAHALRRGTRGFAAVVLSLTGAIVSAVTLFVLPAAAITSTALTILVALAVLFSIAHFVGVYGLIRRREWVAPLTLYLVAIGLGLAAFGGLLLVTGFDPLGRPEAEAALESRVQVLGLLVWLAGSWIVAGRFALRGMAPPERRDDRVETRVGVQTSNRPRVAHPFIVGVDATSRRTEYQPSSA